jgi:hypothetical protein
MNRASMGLGLLLLGGCVDPAIVMHEEYVSVQGVERYLGGGCSALEPGASTSTGVGGDNIPNYQLRLEGTNSGGVEVTVSGDQGSVRITRSYSRTFLLSEEVDELVVDLDGGQVRLRYWGGDRCGPVRSLDPM